MSDFWAQVDALLAAGKEPVITLSPSAEIRKSKKQRGRPRYADASRRYAHWPMHRPGGRTPMTCRARGCRRLIYKNRVDIVCSERCRQALLTECKILLDILEGRKHPTELPPHMRVCKAGKRTL